MPEYAIFVSELEEFKGIISTLREWYKETNPLHFSAYLEGLVRPYLDKTRFGYYVKGDFVIILQTHLVELEDRIEGKGNLEADDRLTDYIRKEYLVPLDDKRFGISQRLATKKPVNWEVISQHIMTGFTQADGSEIPLLDKEGRINGTNYQLPSHPQPEREQLPISYYDLMSIVSKLERDLDRADGPKNRTHSIVCYTLATISCFTGKDAVIIVPKDMCDNCGDGKENPDPVEEQKEETIVVQDCAGNVLEVPDQPKKKIVRRKKQETA
jgi:hypothetical protein